MKLEPSIYDEEGDAKQIAKKRAKQNDERLEKLEKENRELRKEMELIKTNHLPHMQDDLDGFRELGERMERFLTDNGLWKK